MDKKNAIRLSAVGGLILLYLMYSFLFLRPSSSGVISGEIDIFSDPVQKNLKKEKVIKTDDYDGFKWTITAKAEYDLKGILRSSATYSLGWETHFSPIDYCVSWGILNRDHVVKHVTYGQSDRWYFYRYSSECPANNGDIIRHSCNAHLIPANSNIAKALKYAGVGDRVQLKGYLVQVFGTKGKEWYKWVSSMTRNDTGDHSCEVFYVNYVVIDRDIYK